MVNKINLFYYFLNFTHPILSLLTLNIEGSDKNNQIKISKNSGEEEKEERKSLL